MPVVSLWMSSLSACQSSSSFPVDLALLPTGLTHLHRSDSLLLVALTPLHGSDPCLSVDLLPCSLSMWISPLPMGLTLPCGSNPSLSLWISSSLSHRFPATGPAEVGSWPHSM